MSAARVRRVVGALLVAAVVAACAPKNPREAEARGDVAWLVAHPSPEATQALGRLAEKDPRAIDALRAVPGADVGPVIAAWQAHTLGKPWGTAFLREALLDPKRADNTARAMVRHDPKLLDFLPDLEEALVRTADQPNGGSVVAGTLASVGEPAAAAVQRRLQDGRSRAAMCRGLASSEAAPQLRELLLKGGPGVRDEAACVGMIVAIAEKDPKVFAWLAKDGEPGLVAAASRPSGLMCDKLVALWLAILDARPAKELGALSVALGEAIKRCPAQLDAPLGKLLKSKPESHAAVVAAVDPYGGALALMRYTCAQLAVVAGQHAHPLTRERAGDAFRHGCLNGR